MSVCGLLAATTHAGVIGGQKISRILEVGRCISVISICSLSPGMLKRAGRMRKGAAACSAADNNFFVLRSASSGPRGVLECGRLQLSGQQAWHWQPTLCTLKRPLAGTTTKERKTGIWLYSMGMVAVVRRILSRRDRAHS